MSRMVPSDLTMSIGGERIPMTMQAKVEHMTADQAAASALFALPDEAEMTRMPITINLAITPELAQIIARAEAAPVVSQPAEPIAPPPPARRPFAQGGVPRKFP